MAAISDQWGNTIARGRGGPANLAELGIETTAREIMLAIDEARSTFASSSQNTKRHFERAWIGVCPPGSVASGNDAERLDIRLRHPQRR